LIPPRAQPHHRPHARNKKNSIKPIFAILLILAAIAGATPEPKTIIGPVRHIVLPSRKDTLPYSDAVLVGNTLYLAGRIGIDPETGKPPSELEKKSVSCSTE
jgi:enamine deaminase RidA (YjgF/YER057c/UK114 family)